MVARWVAPRLVVPLLAELEMSGRRRSVGTLGEGEEEDGALAAGLLRWSPLKLLLRAAPLGLVPAAAL
jgi:hypothetical protein